MKYILTIAIFIWLLTIDGHADYDTDIDYAAIIQRAVCDNDLERAIALNEERNAKIDGERLNWTKIDAQELYYLAKVVHCEAGSDWLTDECQQLVASVLVNRARGPEFCDSVLECALQPGQYPWASQAYLDSVIPSERAVRNAFYVLENGSIAPETVVYQAGVPQGSEVYIKLEVMRYNPIYFCHSAYPELYEVAA